MQFILIRFLLIIYVIILFAFLVRMIGLIIVKQNNTNLQDFSIIILWPFYILTKKGRKLIVNIWKGKTN